MNQRTVAELVRITGGELFDCEPNQNVGIFVNNDKEVVKNCVYVAINGENYSGIDFAEGAVSAGACLVIADKKSEKSLPRDRPLHHLPADCRHLHPHYARCHA